MHLRASFLLINNKSAGPFLKKKNLSSQPSFFFYPRHAFFFFSVVPSALPSRTLLLVKMQNTEGFRECSASLKLTCVINTEPVLYSSSTLSILMDRSSLHVHTSKTPSQRKAVRVW